MKTKMSQLKQMLVLTFIVGSGFFFSSIVFAQDAQIALEELRVQLQEQQLRMEALAQEKEAIKDSLREVTRERDKLDEELFRFMSDVKPVVKKNEESPSQAKVDELKHALEAANRYGEGKHAEIGRINRKNEELQEQIARLTQQIESLQKSINQGIQKEQKPLLEKIEVLERQLNEAMSQSQKKDGQWASEVSGLQKKLEELTAAKETALTQNAAKTEQSMQAMRDEMAKIQNQLLENKARLDDKNKETQSLSAQLADVQGQLKKKDAGIASEVEKARQENVKTMDALKSQMERLERDLKERENVVNNVSTERNQIKTQLDQLKKERDSGSQQIKILENKLQEAEIATNANIESAQRQLQAEIKRLQGEIDKYKNQLSQKDAQKNAEYERKLSELTKTNERLMESLNQAGTQNQTLEGQIQLLQEKIDALLQSIPGKIEEQKMPLEGRIRSLEEDLKKAQEFARVQADLSKSGWEGKVTQLQGVIKEKDETIAKKDVIIKGYADRREVVINDMSIIDEQNKLLKNEMEAVRLQMTETQQSIPQKIAQAKEPLLAQVGQLKTEVRQLNEQVGSSEKSISTLESEKKSWMAKADAALKDKESVSLKLANVTKNYEELESSLPKRVEEIRAPLANKVAALENQLLLAKSEISKAFDASRLIEQDKKQLAAQLNEEQSAKTKALERIKSLENQWSEKESAYQKQLAALEASGNEKVASLNNLINQKEQAIVATQKSQDEFSALLKKNAGQLAEQTKTIDTLGAQLKSKNDELAAKSAEFSKVIEQNKISFAEQLSDVNAMAERLSAESQNKEKIIAQKESEAAGLAKKLAQLEASHASLNEAFTQAQNQVVSLKNSAAAETATLKKQFEADAQKFNNEISALKNTLKSNENTLAQLTSQKESVNNQFLSKNKENEALNSKIEELNALLAQTKANAVKDVELARQPLNETINQLNSKIKSLTSGVAEKEKVSQDLLARVRNLEGAAAQLANEKQSLNEKLAQANGQVQSLAASMPDKIASAVGVVEEKVVALNNQLAESQKLLKQKESEIAQASQKYSALSRELNSAIQANQKMEIKMGEMAASAEEVNASIPSQIARERKPLEEKIVSLENDKAGALSALKEKDVMVLNLAEEKKALLSRLEVESKAKENLALKVEELTRVAEDFNAGLPERIAAARKPLEEKILFVQGEKESIEGRLKDTETSVARLTEEKKSLLNELSQEKSLKSGFADKVEELTGQLSRLSASVPEKIAFAQQSFEEKMASVQKEKAVFQDSLKEKESLLVQMNDEKNNVASQLVNAQKANAALSSQLAQLTQKTEQLNEKNVQLTLAAQEEKKLLQDKINDAEVSLKRLSDDNKSLLTQLSQEKSLRDNFAKKNESLSQEAAKLSEQWARKIADSQKAWEGKFAGLEQSLNEKSAIVGEKESVVKQLAAERNVLQGEVKDLKSRLEIEAKTSGQVRAELENLKNSLGDITAQAKAPLEQRVVNLGNRIEDLEATLNSKAEEIAALSSARDAQKNLITSLASDKKQNIDVIENLKRIVAQKDNAFAQQLAAEKAPLLEKIALMEKEIVDAKEVAAYQDNVIAEQLQETEGLDSQLKEVTSAKAAIEAQAKEYVSRLDNLTAMQEQELAKAKQAFQNDLAVVKQKLEEEKEKLSQVLAQEKSKTAQMQQALNADLTKLREDFVAQKKAMDALSLEKAALEKTKVALERSAAELSEQASTLKNNAMQEAAQWKQKLDTVQKEFIEKISNYESQIKQSASLNNDNQKQLNDALAAKKKLEESLQGAVAAQEAKESEVKNLQAKLSAQGQSAKEELAKATKVLQEQLANVNAKANDLTIALKSKEAEVEKIAAANKIVVDNFEKAKADEARLKADLAKNAEQLQGEFVRRDNAVNAALKPLADKIQSLENELAQSKQIQLAEADRLQGLIKENNALAAQLKAKMDEVTSLQLSRDEMAGALKNTEEKFAQALAGEKNKMGEQSVVLGEKIKAIEAELKTQTSQAAVLSNELQAALKAKESLSVALESKDKELAAMQSSVKAGLEQAKKPLADELSVLKNKLGELEKSNAQEIAQIKAQAKDECAFLDAQLKANAAMVEQKQKEIQALTGKVEDGQKKIAQEQSAKSLLEEKLVALTQQIENANAASGQKIDEARNIFGAQVQALKEQMVKKEEQLNVLIKEKDVVISEKQKLSGDLASLQNALTQAQAEKQKTEEALKQREADFASRLKASVSSVEESLAQLKSEKSELTIALSEKTQQLSQLSGQAQQLNDSAKKLEADKAGLSARVAVLEESLKINEKSVAEKVAKAQAPLNESVRQLNDNLKRLEASLKEKDALISRLEAESQAVVKQSAEKEAERQALSSQLKTLEEKLNQRAALSQEELTAAQQRFNEEKNTLAVSLSQMKEILGQKESEVKELSSTLQKVTADVANFTSKNNSLNNELAQLKSQLAAVRGNRQSEIEKATAPLAAKLKALEEKNALAEQSLAEKQSALARLQADAANTSNALLQKEAQSHDLEGQIKTLNESMAKLQDANHQQVSGIENNYKQQLESLMKELQESQSAYAIGQESVKQLSAQLAQEKNILKSKSDEVAALKSQLDGFNQKLNDQLTKTADDFNAQLQALQSSLSQKERLLSEKEALVASSIKEKEALENQIKTQVVASQELSGERDNLKKQLVQIENEWAQKIEAEKIQSDAQLKILNDKLAMLDKDLAGQASAQSALENANASLKQSLKSLNDQNASLSAQAQEAQRNIQSLQSQMASAQKPLQSQVDELKKRVDAQVADIQNKELSLVEINKEKQALLSQMEELKSIKLSLENDIKLFAEKSKMTEDLKAQMEGEKIPLLNSIADFKAQIQALTEKISQKDQLIESLNEQIRFAQQRQAQATGQKDRLLGIKNQLQDSVDTIQVE